MKNIIMILLAIALISIGMRNALNNNKFVDNANQTKGYVIGFKETVNKNGISIYTKIIEYSDADGNKHTFNFGSYPFKKPLIKQKEVKVYYDKSDSKLAKLNSTFYLWGLQAILIVGGLFLLFVGFLSRSFID